MSKHQATHSISQEFKESIRQELKEVMVEDDRPIDHKVPGSAFALVSLSYLLLLAAVMAGMGVSAWLYS